MNLAPNEWARLLDAIETTPTAGEVGRALADARDIPEGEAYEQVEAAIEDGVLEEVDTGGAFDEVTVAGATEEEESNSSEAGDEIEATTEPDPERVHEAFADAIAFFHNQLDRELPGEDTPATPREYYEEVRGWDPETIEAKQLGWAPASETALLDHLMRRGYDRAEILGTGLFYEGLTPHFRGRYVLPYFDEDGRPVYAISRSLDERNGGHPADHHGEQKYTKAAKDKEYSHVDEPIYGAETVDDDTDRLLVAGGIADAITLHEAGYACISPVTTVRFKDRHEPEVAALLDRHDIDRVYLVNDAERPTVDRTELAEDETPQSITHVLTIQQYGEGLRGAFGNVEFLQDADATPYLVDLPAGDGDLRKLDPDDYVMEKWGSVEALLASAKPAGEDARYRDWLDRRRMPAETPEPTQEYQHDGDGTALFDLSFTDVTGLSVGDRTDNPLGHHGNSHEYFTVVEKSGEVFGRDHKYGVAYNALSYLLCAADERRADDPNGPLSDWEVFAAWRYAKEEGVIPEDDPIPYVALREVAIDDGVVNADDVVKRDSETGEVVEDPDAHDGSTYTALPPGTYNDALAHIEEEYGVNPGREPVESNGRRRERSETDPRDVDVVVDPQRAWRAASLVTPDDFDDAQPLALDADGDGWRCDCGETIDVVRAAALTRGLIDDCDAPLADDYGAAYEAAREVYGAPLPRYLTAEDATARYDVVLGAIRETTYHHINRDALRSEITAEGDDVADNDVMATLNPAWRESVSEESVIVFESGTVWDADTERTIDVVRLAALEHGLIEDPTETPEGEAFREAYNLARTEYGAPLPRWEVGTPDDYVPLLPEAEDLITEDATPPARDDLDDARAATDRLYRELATETGGPSVNRALPGLGKSYAAVANAKAGGSFADDDRPEGVPTSYLAQRVELMDQAAQLADELGVRWLPLPVFGAAADREPLAEAAAAVRDRGQDLLRNRWALIDAIDAGEGDIITDEADPEDVEEPTEFEQQRPVCATAAGAHGEAWALVVATARKLDYTPREIHQDAHALFGSALPCQPDCPYSQGWEAVTDADAPPDLLIGQWAHANVESVRTEFSRTPTGSVTTRPRTVVIDEYPGLQYAEEFGPEAMDHATWLANSLVADIDDRQDMIEADLWGNEFVRAWLDGEAADVDGVQHAINALRAREHYLRGVREIENLLDAAGDRLEDMGLAEPLRDLADADISYAAIQDAYDRASERLADVKERHGDRDARFLSWVSDAKAPVASALLNGGVGGQIDVNPTDIDGANPGGDLAALVERAVSACEENADDAEAVVEAARRALEGGEDGAQALAVWANGGWAHRDAHHLLRAVIAPTDGRAARIETEGWTFGDGDGGTTLKRVEDGRTVTLLDRNHHGALLLSPPSRTTVAGEDAPLVGLDATARQQLWSVALGEDVTIRDIHGSARERAEFLRDVHGLRVLRVGDQARPYEGDPGGKDTDSDAALLQQIADRYGGVVGPRARDDGAGVVRGPAAITSKGVRGVLEDDDRLEDVVGAWEHFGNLTGANDLGEFTLAAILGSPHYGHDAVERIAALAGEEARASGRGMALDYGSDIANDYLRHMREDQLLQAALRFTRGDTGALVAIRSAALPRDLPVVGTGRVATTWSPAATAIADAWRHHPSDRFTVADVADAPGVDVGRRQVRRLLSELATAGYLKKHETGEGLPNEFERGPETPRNAEFDLPEGTAPGDPGQDAPKVTYTANVRVAPPDGLLDEPITGVSAGVFAPEMGEPEQSGVAPPD